MKQIKVLTVVFTLSLIVSTFPVQAKVIPEVLASKVDKQTNKHLPVYLNNRVKQMCEEWPSCKEWVTQRAKEVKCFHVADTEIER